MFLGRCAYVFILRFRWRGVSPDAVNSPIWDFAICYDFVLPH